MDKYIRNLLPRLRQYGQKLNRIEAFTDRVWTICGEGADVKTYRFKRNNTLRISVNGNFTDCRWEMEGLDAIAIYHPGKASGEIFRHGFVLDGLLVVQKEGAGELPFVFFDEAVIQDGDVAGYIHRELVRKMQLNALGAEGAYYTQTIDGYPSVGQVVYTKELEPVTDTVITVGKRLLYVRNGKVERIINLIELNTDRGTLTLHATGLGPEVGARAYINEGILEDGKYVATCDGEKHVLSIENGVITGVKVPYGRAVLIILGTVLGIVLILLVFYLVFPPSKTSQTSVKPDSVTVSHELAEGSFVDTPTITYLPTTDISDVPDEAKVTELKSRAARYFDAISTKNWPQVEALLSSNLDSYLGGSQVPNSEVLRTLQGYWATDSRMYVMYDYDAMWVTPDSKGYQVKARVVERGVEGFYRTPVDVEAEIFLSINEYGNIFSITSEIKNKWYDFYRMFDMEEGVTQNDYVARNNTYDWKKILDKLATVGREYPSELSKYTGVIRSLYGDHNFVILEGRYYTLDDYISALVNGREYQTSFTTVTSNDQGGKDLRRN